jgi:hypothetical protein
MLTRPNGKNNEVGAMVIPEWFPKHKSLIINKTIRENREKWGRNGAVLVPNIVVSSSAGHKVLWLFQ